MAAATVSWLTGPVGAVAAVGVEVCWCNLAWPVGAAVVLIIFWAVLAAM